MLKVARAAMPDDGPFHKALLTEYDFVPDEAVDRVISTGALEYLASEAEAFTALRQMARILRANGTIATALNNDGSTPVSQRGRGTEDKLFLTKDWWKRSASQLCLKVMSMPDEYELHRHDLFKKVPRYAVFLRKRGSCPEGLRNNTAVSSKRIV